MIVLNIITILTLATSTIQLLQGTPSERAGGQRRGLGNEDLIGGSHEYGSHRGARTDSDLESPDAGDDATFTSILIF